jgi:hypothetical protein
MEIGPMSGVRAVSLVTVHRIESALPPAFEIDASARADDEAHAAERQTAKRGLEEEDSDLLEEGDAEGGLMAVPWRRGHKVDYLA